MPYLPSGPVSFVTFSTYFTTLLVISSTSVVAQVAYLSAVRLFASVWGFLVGGGKSRWGWGFWFWSFASFVSLCGFVLPLLVGGT